MDEHSHHPSVDRLSVITATILLAYALTAFINLPTREVNIQLPGFLFTARLNFVTLVSLVVAVLAAAGTDWLISDHPHFERRTRYEHWLIPAFTAMVIGVPLNALEVSSSWWIVFALGAVLLVGVFIAEFISVDPSDVRYALARISLTAVLLALLLVLLIAVRGAGLRLYIVLAAIFPTVALVAIKALHLQLGGWNFLWAGGIALVVTQLSVGLFYLPFRPLQFGLLLLGICYALISMSSNIEDGRPLRTLWIEPAIILGIFVLISVIAK